MLHFFQYFFVARLVRLEYFRPFKSGILIIGICFKLNHKKALMADKMGFIKGSVTRKSELNDKRRYTDCTAVP